MRFVYILSALFLTFSAALAQGTLLPAGNPAYHIVNRLRIKSGGSGDLHTSLRYYRRGDVVAMASGLDTTQLSRRDLDDIRYIYTDNTEWQQKPLDKTLIGKQTEVGYVEFPLERESERPLLKYFYRTPAALFEVKKPGFDIIINPLLDGGLAFDAEDNKPLFMNRRGLEIRGSIDDRIYFETNVVDGQARLPRYARSRVIQTDALPGQGLFKPYKSSIGFVQRTFPTSYDFLNAQGLIGFNVTKHVGIQFGHGRNFIGNGQRSMLLSDFTNNSLFLRMNARIWKLHYQTIITELTAATPRQNSGTELLPKKFMAAHYLSYRVTPRLNVGIYEAVLFSRPQFELQYLNPVIFYRTVEGLLGSSDNVLLGGDLRWDFARRFSLYGQVLLDEFDFANITAGDGWWGNKFALQAGLQYIDMFGIDHLDGRIEYNLARPYTYTHVDSLRSYTHANQPLAHPLGANFREMLAVIKYQPTRRWSAEARLFSIKQGDDADTSFNWGSNLLLSYQTRERENGNFIGQGTAANTLIGALDISYMFYHNMYADIHFFYRNKNSELDTFDMRNMYIGAGLRMNLWRWELDF